MEPAATAVHDGPAGTPVLEARHVQKAYQTDDGPKVAVADITFSVAPGEFVCVVGPSGAGKTTLDICSLWHT